MHERLTKGRMKEREEKGGEAEGVGKRMGKCKVGRKEEWGCKEDIRKVKMKEGEAEKKIGEGGKMRAKGEGEKGEK